MLPHIRCNICIYIYIIIYINVYVCISIYAYKHACICLKCYSRTMACAQQKRQRSPHNKESVRSICMNSYNDWKVSPLAKSRSTWWSLRIQTYAGILQGWWHCGQVSRYATRGHVVQLWEKSTNVHVFMSSGPSRSNHKIGQNNMRSSKMMAKAYRIGSHPHPQSMQGFCTS